MMRGSIVRAVLCMVILLGFNACSESISGKRFEFAAQRFSMEDREYAIVFPPTKKVIDEFLTLVVNFDGMDGVLEFITLSSGVDLSREDFFEATGLDPEFRPAVFSFQKSHVLVLATTAPSTSSEFLADTLGRMGKAPDITRTSDGVDVWSLSPSIAVGFTDNLIVCVFDSIGSAKTSLASLLIQPGPSNPVAPKGESVDFTVRLRHGGLVSGIDPLLRQLGPASGLVRTLVDFFASCTEVKGQLTPSDRYSLNLVTTGCIVPFAGSPAQPPEAMLPEDTVLVTTLVRPGQSLWDWLGDGQQSLLKVVWTQLPDVPKAFKNIEQLLKSLEPEISMSFLGLSDTIPITSVTSPNDILDPLFAIQVQVQLALKPGVKADDWIGKDGLAAALGAAYTSKPIEGPYTGREFCQTKDQKKCFSVVYASDRLVFVSGKGQGLRLVRSLAGETRTLRESLFAQQTLGPLTLTFKTRRLARDLRAKGLPPNMIRVLSSILEIRLVAEPTETGSRIAAEVVLR